MTLLDEATLIRAELELLWPPEFVDAVFTSGELAIAASCYAAQAYGRVRLVSRPHEFAGWTSVPADWPLHSKFWVQFRSARHSIARAAACLAMEADRLDRLDRAAAAQRGAA